MLLNVSYNDRKIKEQIDKEVGPPFSLIERWKIGGIGSSKLSITHASIDIHNLLVLDNNSDNCNIELRPNGIIIRFRSLLETYGLVIPYYKLKISYSVWLICSRWMEILQEILREEECF